MTDKDMAKISETYHNWRKKSEPGFSGLNYYHNVAGFCKSVCIDQVRKK